MEKDLKNMVRKGYIDFSVVGEENSNEGLLKQILVGFLKPLCLFNVDNVQFTDNAISCKSIKGESKLVQNEELIKAFYREYSFVPLDGIKLEKDNNTKNWKVYIKYKNNVKDFKAKGLTEDNTIEYQATSLFEIIYEVFRIEVMRSYS